MKTRSSIILFLAVVAIGLVTYSYTQNNTRTFPFSEVKNKVVGAKIDSLNGVYVYYNGSMGHVSGRNVTADGYNLGLKYQCVEFIKRYYYQYYQHKMPDSYGNAKDFFQKGLPDGSLNNTRALIQFTNGSHSAPKVGDILVLDGSILNKYGHVAIISKVNQQEIEVIQQNEPAGSRANYSLSKKEGKWTLDNSRILGWLSRP